MYRLQVVDDSPKILDLVCRILTASGEFDCVGYGNGAEMLARFRPGELDCVLTDLKMPEVDGEQLHRRLAQLDPMLSVVIVTGYADVKTAVRLMEQGTFTLLEKPFSAADLRTIAERAAERTRQRRRDLQPRLEEAARISLLSEEEREVLDGIIAGLPNKAIAYQLAISPRTLDRRRQSVMKKLQVNSAAEVAALVARACDVRK
ncbi:MAG: response regulator [Pirellulaceae bacterium]